MLNEPHWSVLIGEMRARLGLSQEKLAAKLGVSFPTVNRWENNRAAPSPLALQKIEELLSKMKDAGTDLLNEYFPEDGL